MCQLIKPFAIVLVMARVALIEFFVYNPEKRKFEWTYGITMKLLLLSRGLATIFFMWLMFTPPDPLEYLTWISAVESIYNSLSLVVLNIIIYRDHRYQVEAFNHFDAVDRAFIAMGIRTSKRFNSRLIFFVYFEFLLYLITVTAARLYFINDEFSLYTYLGIVSVGISLYKTISYTFVLFLLGHKFQCINRCLSKLVGIRGCGSCLVCCDRFKLMTEINGSELIRTATAKLSEMCELHYIQ